MRNNMKITAKQEQARPALVPKLRFPEFRGADGWENAILGDLSVVVRGGSPRPIDGFLTPAADGLNWLKIGDVDKEAKYVTHTEEKVRPEALSKTRVVNPGDLILSNSMSFGRPYILQIKTCIHDGWIAITDIAKNADRDFLYYLISAPSSQSYFVDNAAGSGVQNLNADIIKALPICFPLPAEQQKIAECLSSVDELMAAQARKVAALKTHKKGLMQQLFPREGESQPRLRFPEFQNAGEWEVKTLEAIAPLQRGFDLPSQEIRPGQVPIVYSNGPKGFHAEGMAIGPGLVTGRSGTIGKLHFVEGGAYWPHNPSLWVTSFKGHVPKFVYFLFDFIGFLRFASGSGVPTLNRNDAHSFETSVPPTPPEQQRIATCLSSIDTLITTETQKHEALKTHKKALMQQLFPSPGETLP
jgi:type I restriction enzyme S subunit